MATKEKPQEPTAYDALPQELTAQVWRNAFGLLQVRVKELEARLKALETPKRDVPRSTEPVSNPPTQGAERDGKF